MIHPPYDCDPVLTTLHRLRWIDAAVGTHPVGAANSCVGDLAFPNANSLQVSETSSGRPEGSLAVERRSGSNKPFPSRAEDIGSPPGVGVKLGSSGVCGSEGLKPNGGAGVVRYSTARLRANCGAAVLVPAIRKTAPLRVPPARTPAMADEVSDGAE